MVEGYFLLCYFEQVGASRASSVIGKNHCVDDTVLYNLRRYLKSFVNEDAFVLDIRERIFALYTEYLELDQTKENLNRAGELVSQMDELTRYLWRITLTQPN